jgi:hypothetical membrane protein
MLNNKFIKYAGIIAIIAAWVTILIAILANPWFGVTRNALSDLGGGNKLLNGHPSPIDPFIYNGGLMVTGIIIAIFSSSVIIKARNKIENTGMAFFIIAGLFLALIGIYHEGTYPHEFVSIWFFIIASIAYETTGISLLFTKFKNIAISILLIVPASWAIFITVPWQSVAEDEIFGIIIIDIMVFLHILTFSMKRK